jgi:uncharacterized protein (DUF697 family)/ethanolamine utilization protein EutP (predicted NTPase)
MYKSREEENNFMDASILVCGYTGCGKTSLVQAVCGKSTVPDSAIGHGKPETMDFKLYEKNSVAFWDSKGMELGQKEDDFVRYVKNFVHRRQQIANMSKHIHVLWYCIAGDRARVTSCDKNLIRTLFDTVLVVVTKNDIVRAKQRQAIVSELTAAGVREREILFCSSLDNSGLKRLLDTTFDLMPEAQGRAFDRLYRDKTAELKRKADEAADDYVFWGAARAGAIAVIPLPLADMPFLIANQGYMIVGIGSAYGIAVTKGMVAAFLGTLGASIAGMTAASFLPFLKIGIAAGVTYGVGKAAKVWFENDMKASATDLKKVYTSAKREAKKRNWKKEAGKFDADTLTDQKFE